MFQCSCKRAHPSSDRIVRSYILRISPDGKSMSVRIYKKCNYCGKIYSFTRDFMSGEVPDYDFISRDILPEG